MDTSNNSLIIPLLEQVQKRGDNEVLVCNGKSIAYGDLYNSVIENIDWLRNQEIKQGSVVGLQSDFSLEGISFLLALLSLKTIVAIIPASMTAIQPFVDGGRLEKILQIAAGAPIEVRDGILGQKHHLIEGLVKHGRAGFIVYSSGSSGVPKAVLHDLGRFLKRYRSAKKRFRTLMFLLFDHIAGIDTMFYTLFSGGVMIVPKTRDPESICELVATQKVEVLPASPTFYRLLLMSGAHHRHALNSLKIITYGSEPMNIDTLRQLTEAFPDQKIIQKYGTSEFGAPPSKSRGDGELWLRINSDQFKTRIEKGLLWVKTHSTMLGYLNAPQPESRGDWICTGDQVEVDGDWIRILGRQSDMINVGGEKVFPAEVEDVIEQIEEVIEVAVYGESHPFLGQCVCAKVRSENPENWNALRKKIRKHCRIALPSFKIPTKIEHSLKRLVGERQKKLRCGAKDES